MMKPRRKPKRRSSKKIHLRVGSAFIAGGARNGMDYVESGIDKEFDDLEDQEFDAREHFGRYKITDD